MILDLNATVGHYPFRALPATTADQVVALMEQNGIARALVTSVHAAFYRDAHRGNEELFAQVKPHGARLIPVATINPRYAGWERDLAESIERWKSRAIALVPEHHGYALTDEPGRSALAKISEYGVPVLLSQRFEDRRQRHAWDKSEELAVPALLDAAKTHPQLKFLLVNWAGLDGERLVQAGLKGRCLIDFARLQVVFRKEVPRLIATLGLEALAFGSHLPFDYVGPSLVKLANLQMLRPADWEDVAWRNAVRFLRLEG